MTLWLPVLDYARSYVPVVQGVTRLIDKPGCVSVMGLNRGQIAALRYHAGLDLRAAEVDGDCAWLLMPQELQPSLGMALDARQWSLRGTVRRPTDARDNLLVYRKAG
jgi:hypothetical protein